MIKCQQLKGKKIYIVGLGRTGIGAIASLLASGSQVFAWDDNQPSRDICLKKYPNITFSSPTELEWQKIDFVLLSPGIPTLPGNEHEVVKYANKHSLQIISDMDVLYLACPKAKYIGITGTNGKSTTTALIGHILTTCNIKNQVGGNIGISVLELEQLDEDGVYVLETSSFQLDLLKFAKFNIALLLNITPDHLDRHGTMENYINAKLQIFRKQNDQDKAIISKDYPTTNAIIHKLDNVTSISTIGKADVYMDNRILFDNNNKLQFDFNDYKFLPGKHNEENIAAAYAAVISLGVEAEKIVHAIKGFKGSSSRLGMPLVFVHLKRAFFPSGEYFFTCTKFAQNFDDVNWYLLTVSISTKLITKVM